MIKGFWKFPRKLGQSLLKITLPVSIFTLLTAGQANAHGFSGWVYDAANGVSSDSALVKLINPFNDTLTTKVSELGPKYWTETPSAGWINTGDTCKIIVVDTTGQQARTFAITNSPSNFINTLFPGGHSFLIKSIYDSGIDSVDAKCYSKGTVWSDTLEGRFMIGIPHDDIYFNRAEFKRPPALNDSFIIEIFEGNLYARTGGIYKKEFWDADTAPRCTLHIVGTKENLEKKANEAGNLIIKPNPATNYIIFGRKIEGDFYDASGKKISDIDGDRFDLREYPQGVYFIKSKKIKQRIKVIIIK